MMLPLEYKYILFQRKTYTVEKVPLKIDARFTNVIMPSMPVLFKKKKFHQSLSKHLSLCQGSVYQNILATMYNSLMFICYNALVPLSLHQFPVQKDQYSPLPAAPPPPSQSNEAMPLIIKVVMRLHPPLRPLLPPAFLVWSSSLGT